MASQADKKRLERIRHRHAEASVDWALLATSRQFERISVRFVEGIAPTPIATLTDDCSYQDRDFILSAHSDISFLLNLLAEAFRTIRNLRQQMQSGDRAGLAEPSAMRNQADQPKPANYSAECAMKCGEPVFIRFLSEKHGLQADNKEAVAACVREALSIGSRSDLNKNPEAAERWISMRADFDVWRKYP